MQDELKSKAPGMRFGVDVTEKPRPMPRVIHALGKNLLSLRKRGLCLKREVKLWPGRLRLASKSSMAILDAVGKIAF